MAPERWPNEPGYRVPSHSSRQPNRSPVLGRSVRRATGFVLGGIPRIKSGQRRAKLPQGIIGRLPST